jgi:ParB/RepB/Spo0J family partition protein
MDILKMVPLSLISESPFNPRKYFDPAKMQELTDSVKIKGIETPVRVRPKEAGYQLVFGARRLRAAQGAGLQEVPAIIREMSDLEVREAQVAENLQREDVHPLEEADAFHDLHKLFGRSVEEIAHQVGKSAGYVYARLRLCALAPPAREAFFAGQLTATTALLVARIPNAALQGEATKEITRTDYRGEVMSAREAGDLVQRKYMLRLDQAPFKTTEASLLPEVGACTTCHKRTGNQRELFADVKSADVCTDPPCYQKKVDALWQIRARSAKSAGQKVIEKPAPYIDLKSHCPQDGKNRTYEQLLGKKGAGADIVLARDPGGGIHELVPKENLSKLLKAAGHDLKKLQADTGNDQWKKQEQKRKKEHAIRQKVVLAALGQVAAAAEKRWSDPVLWRVLVGQMDFGPSEVLERREVAAKALPKYLDGLAVPQLFGLLVELTAAIAGSRIWKDYPKEFTDLCKLLGVDLNTLDAAARAEAGKAAKKPKPKPKVSKPKAAAAIGVSAG